MLGARLVRAPCESHQRARGARAVAPGDADPGPSVRHGPHHRRGAGAHAGEGPNARYRYSFDMLGEAALTAADAVSAIFEKYRGAIIAVERRIRPDNAVTGAPQSISVKLSALHPRYEFAQRASRACRSRAALLRSCNSRATAGIGFTDRRRGGRTPGTVAAADRSRCCASDAARRLRRLWACGAGLSKAHTGASRMADRAHARTRRRSLACASSKAPTGTARSSAPRSAALPAIRVHAQGEHGRLLSCLRAARSPRQPTSSIPQFATHNAHTVAYDHGAFRASARRHSNSSACTAWARSSLRRCRRRCRRLSPAASTHRSGTHEDLLPYLVRRLLENGANTSFVNRVVDRAAAGGATSSLIPLPRSTGWPQAAHPRIVLPQALCWRRALEFGGRQFRRCGGARAAEERLRGRRRGAVARRPRSSMAGPAAVSACSSSIRRTNRSSSARSCKLPMPMSNERSSARAPWPRSGKARGAGERAACSRTGGRTL